MNRTIANKIILLLLIIVGNSSCEPQNDNNKNILTQNIDSLNYLGTKYFSENKFDSSLIVYDILVKKDSVNADFIFERGAVKWARHDLLGSLQDMNKCLLLESKHTQAIYYKALIFEQMTIIDSSNVLFSKLLTLKPDSALYLMERAKYYERQNRLDLSMLDWNSLLKKYPNTPEYLNQRGMRFLTMKNYSAALKDFNQSISINPVEYNLRNRSQTYYFLGEYKESLSDIEKAIELNPNNPENFTLRGAIKYHLKDEVGACEDFAKAAQMGNEESKTYYKDCIDKRILNSKTRNI